MATTIYRNKNLRRPTKSAAARRQRNKVHRRRLIALGLPAEQVEKMGAKEMRTLLRKPAKISA